MENDWKFLAIVLDRLFLITFSLICLIGTIVIVCQAPTLYDYRTPIDVLYTQIADS